MQTETQHSIKSHSAQFASLGNPPHRRRLADVLPQSLPPRGVCREEAAAYVGVSASLFDILVKDGRMPPPKRINARKVWDRNRLDAAFASLPDDGEVNTRAMKSDPWANLAA
ncbi:helix-turn-helix transcriptional regulator [Methylobacterium nigriterrae]|uniref:helix-turn-helix transcriptional regulator n=1 Tax=Methylobacterium nigriterrae TaxID=3127512 RepID=UPI003D670C87